MEFRWFTKCKKCGEIAKREEWYPEPQIRHQSNCDSCGDEIVEQED